MIPFSPESGNVTNMPGRSGQPLDISRARSFRNGSSSRHITTDNVDNSDNAARNARIKEAAEGFEAIFIRQLFKAMRETIPGGGMFGEGTEGEIYGDMMDYHLAEVLSEKGMLGLAEAIERQLLPPDGPQRRTSAMTHTFPLKEIDLNDDISTIQPSE